MKVSKNPTAVQANGRKGSKPPPLAQVSPEVSNDHALSLSASDEQEITRLRRLGLYPSFSRGRPFRPDDAKKFWGLGKDTRNAVPAVERIRATDDLLKRGMRGPLGQVIFAEGLLSTHQILTATFGRTFGLPGV